jgi:hypothetical protein
VRGLDQEEDLRLGQQVEQERSEGSDGGLDEELIGSMSAATSWTCIQNSELSLERCSILPSRMRQAFARARRARSCSTLATPSGTSRSRPLRKSREDSRLSTFARSAPLLYFGMEVGGS